MQACDFEAIKDFILSKNTYLHHAYANAYKDERTKMLLAKNWHDVISMLPDDTKGNYCYLRVDTTIKHEPQVQERVSDNGAQRLVFLDTVTLYLVVVVDDADAYKLLNNLRNTCMMYEDMDLQPTASNWNREQILMEEMAGMRGEDITAALQRLKNETIVKLTIKASAQYIPSTCITDTCKTC
jgi:hypothetical protein